MFWQEDQSDQAFKVPDDVVDVVFALDCRRLPVDHAHALSEALRHAVPWLAEATGAGVHTIHVAGSQNGWQRPEHGRDQHLIVSRRSKLTIRIPAGRMNDLMQSLTGKTLAVADCSLTVGPGKPRLLSKETTLFARYIVTEPDATEEQFLTWAANELARIDIHVRKAVCGRSTLLATPEGAIPTRSLMLADLTPEQSVRLQEAGLGPNRIMGCGIFIPHKGIEAVKKAG